MTTITGTAHPSAARPAIPLKPFVLAIVAMAYAGFHLSVASFGSQPAHPPVVGEAIPTSFGSITVTSIETVDGLTAEDLGGRVHGVSGLVTAESAALRLTIVAANSSDRTVRVSPSDFQLSLDGALDSSMSATSAPGLRSLPPRSSLEATVVFVVPRVEAGLAVTYAAPGSEPLAIATGRTTDGPVTADTHAEDEEDHP